MVEQTNLADALNQAGSMAEAETLFKEVEAIQKKMQPKYPLLYSTLGFRYCDLLLSMGKYKEVLNRVEQTIEWEEERLLDTALDHLSLGRAHLLQTLHEGRSNSSQASDQLNQALMKPGPLQSAVRWACIRLTTALDIRVSSLAMGDKEKARGELAVAKEMITKMGYHRRDGSNLKRGCINTSDQHQNHALRV